MRVLAIFTFLLCAASSAWAAGVETGTGEQCVTVVNIVDAEGNSLNRDAHITLAAASSGILFQSDDAVRLAPGYRYRPISRGDRNIMQVISPDGGGTGEFECFCSNHHGKGVCFPAMNGRDGVKCTSHTNGCHGTCKMNVLIPPPPPPPTN